MQEKLEKYHFRKTLKCYFILTWGLSLKRTKEFKGLTEPKARQAKEEPSLKNFFFIMCVKMNPFLESESSTVQSRFSNIEFSGYSSTDHFSIYYIKSTCLVTCNLLTIFAETKSVTKSRVHCIFEFLNDCFSHWHSKKE